MANADVCEHRRGGMGWLSRVRADVERVGLFVDGPNVFREEFEVDLDNLRAVADDEGRPVVRRLYLDEHATPNLLRAAEERGFEVITTSSDVDVRLAVDAATAAVESSIDVLVLVSRDADFKPAVERAAARGVRTVAIAPGSYGRSDALRNAAHDARTLE
jgi:uncharacterized protein (TIGR00288 family)